MFYLENNLLHAVMQALSQAITAQQNTKKVHELEKELREVTPSRYLHFICSVSMFISFALFLCLFTQKNFVVYVRISCALFTCLFICFCYLSLISLFICLFHLLCLHVYSFVFVIFP